MSQQRANSVVSSEYAPSSSTLIVAAFVMTRDQVIEQTYADRRRTLGHQRRIFLRPGGAGDIEMSPRHVIDEALEKLSCGDTAGIAAVADVLHIGGIAVDLTVIRLAQWHAPERLLDRLARASEPSRELVVVAE